MRSYVLLDHLVPCLWKIAALSCDFLLGTDPILLLLFRHVLLPHCLSSDADQDHIVRCYDEERAKDYHFQQKYKDVVCQPVFVWLFNVLDLLRWQLDF